MHPNLFATLSALIITSCFLIGIPQCLCADNEQYVECGELFHCGSLRDIGFPFYGGRRPENCGYPGLELKCERNVPLITFGPVSYRILAVKNTTRTLTVAREDLWKDLCPQLLYNTSLDFNFFSYSANHQNITIYYGCSQIPGQPFLLPNQLDCSVNSTTSFSFYVTGDVPVSNITSMVRCKDNINVPVNQAAAESLKNLVSSASNLRTALTSGFDLIWFANKSTCSLCTESGGQCGHGSSSPFVCYCADGPHTFTCNSTQVGSGSEGGIKLSTAVIIAGVVGTIALAILSITALYYLGGRSFLLSRNWKRNRSNDQNVGVFMRNWGSLAPKQYSYSEIKKITNCFKEKLGQGGYACVYRGKLPNGQQVAVKVLSEAKGDGEDFINEVASISKTSHVNVVTLLGFCSHKKRALIYQLMPNGSLDKYIYKNGSLNADCHLEWKTLYQIAVGIARGLEYLHQGCNTKIVHFDIKPHNILLDEDFCPKISDFGLAKLSERKESNLSMLTARGTAGYMAPEVFFRNVGGVSHKSDVYSFGMMVLEMVGVRTTTPETNSSEVYFPYWIYEHLELGKGLNTQAITCEEEEEISRKLIIVGLWCIQTIPSDRPSMSKVVEMLEGSLHSLQVPPKPRLYLPQQSFPKASTSLSW